MGCSLYKHPAPPGFSYIPRMVTKNSELVCRGVLQGNSFNPEPDFVTTLNSPPCTDYRCAMGMNVARTGTYRMPDANGIARPARN